MANKINIKPYQVVLTILFLLILAFFHWVYSFHFTQEFIGSWLGGLDPQRLQHLEQSLERKSNKQLLALLEHGDFNKASAAQGILMKRVPQELFDPIAQKLNSDSEKVRMAARRILLSIDKGKAGQLMIKEINKYPEDSFDYRDTLRVLAYWKCPGVYPFLIKYASKPKAWHTGAATYLADFGDPAALPLLRDIYKSIPNDGGFSTSLAKDSVKKAIETLEAIERRTVLGT